MCTVKEYNDNIGRKGDMPSSLNDTKKKTGSGRANDQRQ
jgi:hypothetical protein